MAKKKRTEAQVKATKRNRKAGRRLENFLNDMMGMIRQGAYSAQDGCDDHFSVEIKGRKTYAGNKFMDQAVKNCPKGKIPIYVAHTWNFPYEKAHVCIRLSDWLKLMKCIDWRKWK